MIAPRQPDLVGASLGGQPISLAVFFGVDDQPWMDDALCAQVDPELFFPEKGGSTRAAKQTCMACDVRADCLDYALEHNERFGIWGGLSERERRKIQPDLPDDDEPDQPDDLLEEAS